MFKSWTRLIFEDKQNVFQVENVSFSLTIVLISAAGYHEYVTNALYELGRNQLRSSDLKRAFQSFTKLLALARRIPDPEKICDAHMALASVYKLRVNSISMF